VAAFGVTVVRTAYRYKRPPRKRPLPPGLLAETPEEHQRRGEAAGALWRELVRRAAEKP
jgi:hypothetical protein